MSRFVLRSNWLPLMFAGLVAILSPATASAQVKVGVINFQRALLGPAEMKKASADLLAKYGHLPHGESDASH